MTMFNFCELMLFDSMNISKSFIHCLTSVLLGSNLSGGETNNIGYGLIVSIFCPELCWLDVLGILNRTCLIRSTKVLSALGAVGFTSSMSTFFG
ncbi:hypothetical protein BpHYR1_052026 [Brachionus plicatilis]|uniref:Uncharacterized protein n=1 Tax=Brachionus plicatilis TaxID=10195 RepID=A0A3M7PZK1_BRAPC|nr:hypothetical protein BpHYR1_052026 [Brachionus plicatilis]